MACSSLTVRGVVASEIIDGLMRLLQVGQMRLTSLSRGSITGGRLMICFNHRRPCARQLLPKISAWTRFSRVESCRPKIHLQERQYIGFPPCLQLACRSLTVRSVVASEIIDGLMRLLQVLQLFPLGGSVGAGRADHCPFFSSFLYSLIAAYNLSVDPLPTSGIMLAGDSFAGTIVYWRSSRV
ncbi:hypothetical protein J6590_082121 [Homalodisca vitripennis]|nr:hypothetical protein J6590_082121 [Homalodisca vitripennis]